MEASLKKWIVLVTSNGKNWDPGDTEMQWP